MIPMPPTVFWFLLTDVFACACLLAALAVQIKRRAEHVAVRVWSETLDGCAKDMR